MRARHFFTFAKNFQSRSGSTSRLMRNLKVAAGVTAVGISGYNIVKQHIKVRVVDESVLRSCRLEDCDELNVVDAINLHSANDGITSGRTCGHRVYIENREEGKRDYYFYKETYDRDDLVKELFYGALGRHLAGYIFPDVFLVETPLNDPEDHSQYAFLSENVGDDEDNNDLEQWAMLYHSAGDPALVSPSYLGVALAFSMLMGQSDCKLANLAVISDKEYAREGSCYPIDFESCENFLPTFVTSAVDAVKFIGEFRSKNMVELTLEVNSDGMLDTQDDAHKPLRNNVDVKDSIYPVLLQAVQKDLDENSVIEFYRGFVAMTDEDFIRICDKFGTFIKEPERKSLLDSMHYRQRATSEYLTKYDLSKHNHNDIRQSEESVVRRLV